MAGMNFQIRSRAGTVRKWKGMKMNPINIRVENYVTQTGITDKPSICWQYGAEDTGRYQRCCRILVKKEEELVFDSGYLQTSKQNGHIVDCRLETHRQYELVVESIDDQNEKGQGSSRFITGVCRQDDWNGKWISAKSDRPHYIGTDIRLDKDIAFACISVAGVGQYEMKVNGNFPDESIFNGSWTDFNKRINYRTFEITDLMKRGENTVSIEVGNGWYCTSPEERHFYTLDKGYEPFGKYLCAIAEMTIVFADGEILQKGTDKTWWASGSETTFSNIYGAEDYDARLENAQMRMQAFELDADTMPKGKLEAMRHPAVKVIRTYEGKLLRSMEQGGYLYDFGQNMSGLFQIKVSGERGTKIKIIPYEKLDEGGNPCRTVDTWCTYTLSGETQESWQPKFTYSAGRYVWICLSEDSEIQRLPKIEALTGKFISTGAEDSGSFVCSDERYMQIHNLVLRAIESNLNHVHTDCPTIERLGWQEPNHLMGPSVMYVKNVDALWSKIAADQRDSQYRDGEEDTDAGVFPHKYGEGLLPSIAPRYARFLLDGGQGSFWDIVPWGSSILFAAYEQYRFYGNRETLIANYETAKKYVEYLYQKYLDYDLIYGKNSNHHFLRHGLGDWGIEQGMGESRENIETAYLYRNLVYLSETAGWMGKEEAGYYLQLSEKVKEEYNSALLVKDSASGEWFYRAYDKEGQVLTQANQAIPLCFGMVPDTQKESVKRSFLKACSDHVLHTGEIGLPYILRTLGEAGEADIVHDMIMRLQHPSYYRFILDGETTLPEFWRDDARSRNHDMMGAVLEWIYRYLAGISSEDGYEAIRICPVLPSAVDHLRASYQSLHGKIEVEVWKNEDGKLKVRAGIPVNTKGCIIVNGKSYSLGSGEIKEIQETVPFFF